MVRESAHHLLADRGIGKNDQAGQYCKATQPGA